MNQPRALLILALAAALGGFAGERSQASADPPPEPARLENRAAEGDEGRPQLGPDVRALPGRYAPGPRMLVGLRAPLTDASSAAPGAIVRSFLADHAKLYGLAGGGPELTAEQVHVQGGVTHVRFRQSVGGIDVFQGQVKAALDADGRLLALNGTVVPERRTAAPLLTVEEAMSQALASVNGPAAPAVVAGPTGSDRATEFAGEGYLLTPTARLVFFPTAGGGRTGWSVSLPVSVVAWWEIVVDAETGAILHRSSLSAGSGPEGEVFFANLEPDDGPPAIVPFVGGMAAPRDAWLAPAATTTAGNNATSGEDRDGNGAGVYASSATQHFDFGFSDAFETSGGTDPYTDQAASITNGFYWANYMHDYLYALGFTESAGNFQLDNFGAGGVSGDPVNVLVQFAADGCALPDCGGYLGQFVSGPDGIPGFIAMKMAGPPQRYVDSGFIADLWVHEYTHGLSLRLVGSLSGIQSGALNEGWSDWFSGSITGDPVMGEYQSGNYVNGVNFYALDANPLAYSDLCVYGYAGCEHHKEGEIWSGTLWDVRTALMAAYGAGAGKAKAEQLVVDGMMLTPTAPDFLEARDAILQADLAGGGTDQCLLWGVFSSRGMGDGAVSFGDSADVYEAFDLPLECAYPGPDGDGDLMPDSYETLQACLDDATGDAALDPDTDGATNGAEYTQRTDPCADDTDGDGYKDLAPTLHATANTDTATDNCPLVPNGGASQPNNDGNLIDLTPPRTFDDVTRPMSDSQGDACDLDDDNDGISSIAELGAQPCVTASGPLNALLPDTDGDRVMDGVECAFATDPANAASFPPTSVCHAAGDLDADGVRDSREMCHFGTSSALDDSDGDGRDDQCEIASVDNDTFVTVLDLQRVAQHFAMSGLGLPYLANMDVDKDGVITVLDLQYVAQRFPPCP